MSPDRIAQEPHLECQRATHRPRSFVNARRGLIVFVGAVALSVTGCSGGSSGTPSAATKPTSTSADSAAKPFGSTGKQWPTDVCGIVDVATVARIAGPGVTGVAVAPPVETLDYMCDYTGTFVESGEHGHVLQTSYVYETRDLWDGEPGNDNNLAGFGADAFVGDDGVGNPTVHVHLDDGRTFKVQVVRGVGDELAKEKTLAQEILTHT
jgi:hypothetical protein